MKLKDGRRDREIEIVMPEYVDAASRGRRKLRVFDVGKFIEQSRLDCFLLGCFLYVLLLFGRVKIAGLRFVLVNPIKQLAIISFKLRVSFQVNARLKNAVNRLIEHLASDVGQSFGLRFFAATESFFGAINDGLGVIRRR